MIRKIVMQAGVYLVPGDSLEIVSDNGVKVILDFADVSGPVRISRIEKLLENEDSDEIRELTIYFGWARQPSWWTRLGRKLSLLLLRLGLARIITQRIKVP